MNKLDFFLVGAQKAGTTAIDRLLRAHPAIQMARVKEVHFFDDESIDWNAADFAQLHAQFDWNIELPVLRGECTPIYCFWPESIERIFRYNPQAKIIMSLRHPVFRAYSHWKMQVYRGEEHLPFQDAILEESRRDLSMAAPMNLRRFSYKARGFYARQVERILRYFPAQQVLFLRSDAFWTHRDAVTRGLYRFLGVEDPGALPEQRYIAAVAGQTWSSVQSDALSCLRDTYADDIQQTQLLTGLSLSDWLHADYAEPELEHG